MHFETFVKQIIPRTPDVVSFELQAERDKEDLKDEN
jgi:hypothetical protein